MVPVPPYNYICTAICQVLSVDQCLSQKMCYLSVQTHVVDGD